jgi:hypothetical protein
MELKQKYTTVYTNDENSEIRTFYMKRNLRYIDLSQLEKYTVKQLISIFGQKIGGPARKRHYIDYITKRMTQEITQENREYTLNKIGI